MAIQTTGFFTVETGTAVIDVRLRIFLDNLENAQHRAAVFVTRRRNGKVSELLAEEVTLAPGGRRVIEVDDVAGEDVQVTIDLPDREYPQESPIVAGVAVVSVFFPESEVTLLHWIGACDFAPVA